ncbi:MAG: Fic family protein [Bacilli bacterium]|jgi:cell filamentation protein|nr:Fic family protein [Bacilli bacterium]MCH4278064.1 Fic family protein [Bacilli bacterium]
MKRKTSIRYFLSKPVRGIWNNEESCWYFSATDIVNIVVETKDPRRYWNNFKKRHNQLLPFCQQRKLLSSDNKEYFADVINEEGISTLFILIPSKNSQEVQDWLDGKLDPVDEQSKKRAYELFKTDLIDSDLVGTTKCLQQIHSYLFGGLYSFAGQIRTKTISKGGFTFANGEYLPNTLKAIDKMPDSTFVEIISKYIEMNIAHPFMEGNGRATRIWLDLLLKERLSLCIDWSKIGKKEYLEAMEKSPMNDKPIRALLDFAKTSDINNREVYLKGIDCSYYYEEIGE